jgi:hypothetical protein
VVGIAGAVEIFEANIFEVCLNHGVRCHPFSSNRQGSAGAC